MKVGKGALEEEEKSAMNEIYVQLEHEESSVEEWHLVDVRGCFQLFNIVDLMMLEDRGWIMMEGTT
jgi:hypothetical protein